MKCVGGSGSSGWYEKGTSLDCTAGWETDNEKNGTLETRNDVRSGYNELQRDVVVVDKERNADVRQ